MGYHGFDLVYELQVELGWEQDFATAARKEYIRYLELRAKAQDFQQCKLIPSKVIAIVWNLHRLWTADYENVCSTLGGVIHHYPPSMRLGLPSEQAYAATVEMYKSHFNENPPDAYWGTPICPNNPPPSTTDYIANLHAPAQTAWQSQVQTKPRTRPLIRNTRSASFGESTPVAPQDEENNPGLPEKDQAKTDAKLIKPKKITRTSRVQQGYVLRPLPPGEKRKRGRPSMSEYVPVSQASGLTLESTGMASIVDEDTKPGLTGAVSVSGRGSAAIFKARRLQNMKASATAVESQGVNGQSTNKIGEGGVMLKRPRGRPRKDGSWPIPRARVEGTTKAKVESVALQEAQILASSEAPGIVVSNVATITTECTETEAEPLPAKGMMTQEEAVVQESGKEEGSKLVERVEASFPEGDMMDISDHEQKQTEMMRNQQESSRAQFVAQPVGQTNAPQVLDSGRDATA